MLHMAVQNSIGILTPIQEDATNFEFTDDSAASIASESGVHMQPQLRFRVNGTYAIHGLAGAVFTEYPNNVIGQIPVTLSIKSYGCSFRYITPESCFMRK